MFKEIVDRILSIPQKRQVKCSFDLKSKNLYLSIPVYDREMPQCVKEYVEKRKGMHFKPHKSSFHMEDGKVILTQEIPFLMGFQDNTRKSVYQFLSLSRKCRKIFTEMAVEEGMAALDSVFSSY